MEGTTRGPVISADGVQIDFVGSTCATVLQGSRPHRTESRKPPARRTAMDLLPRFALELGSRLRTARTVSGVVHIERMCTEAPLPAAPPPSRAGRSRLRRQWAPPTRGRRRGPCRCCRLPVQPERHRGPAALPVHLDDCVVREHCDFQRRVGREHLLRHDT